jgi:hypothetical protein
MATTIKSVNSEGGFGVNQTKLVTETLDLTNINSFELKNSNFSDVNKKEYILRGLNTAVLTLDGINPITLDSNTINFITGHITAVNPSGTGVYSTKIESVVKCDGSGDVSTLSDLTTIIRDAVPDGQTWSVSTYDTGTANVFSYSTVRSGTTLTIKWIAQVSIVSVSWT